MTKTTKTIGLLAFSAACFAPALGIAWANGSLEEPVAYEALEPPARLAEAGPRPEPAPQVLPVTIVTTRAPRPAAATPRPAPAVRCETRDTELHAGRVRICDVPRTPTAKPGRLAPRDLPSPSGLLR
jgi:hypothetical protein